MKDNLINKQLSVKDRFVFVYDKDKVLYLQKNNIRYICKGIHDGTRKDFWLFDRTKELILLLDRYDKGGNKDGI